MPQPISRLIYIHGFASAGEGEKARILREEFPEAEVGSPTLPANPAEAVELLHSLVRPNTLLVGTSLGGFYAATVTAMSGEVARALLINPVVDPQNRMRRHLGRRKNFKTGETFYWLEDSLELLGGLATHVQCHNRTQGRLALAVGSEDELTDPEEAQEWYGVDDCHIYPDGHRFSTCFRQAVTDWRDGC